MSKDILGSFRRVLITVPENRRSLVKDFAHKMSLSGTSGETWEQQGKLFLRKKPNWVKPIFGKLETVALVKPGEEIGWREFRGRSMKLVQKTIVQEASDFYKKPENWHLMPSADSGINTVVFVGGEKFIYGDNCVAKFLYRGGSGIGWYEGELFCDDYLTDKFHVAVSGAVESTEVIGFWRKVCKFLNFLS